MPLILADLLSSASLMATALLAADWLLRIGLSVRVVMRRSSVGVTLSWLMIVLSFPLGGAAIYLILGENRLGTRRANATVKLHNAYAGWRSGLRDRSRIDWQRIAPGCEAIHRQAVGVSGVPALPGNTLDLFNDSHEALAAIVRDLDAAKLHCHLEFYIWQDGGAVDEVAEALIRAAQRGVTCRVLLDAVGSKNFLRRSPQRRAMADAGVEVVESLPAGIFRALFRRLDLRNHRKLVVVDGCVGYTGSLNMIDPGLFKHDAGVGAWIDAMVRVQGPAVEALAVVFLEDWQLETSQDLGQHAQTRPCQAAETTASKSSPAAGDSIKTHAAAVQVVPSGPSLNPESIHRLLVASIYSARHQVTLTTPYFVPDEALLIALTSAAARGVDTLIILPERNDSFLVRHASNAYLGELLAAGVKVARFRGGLLHTKSVTIDDHLTAFGTVNLDMRSFYLNFELTLFVYDQDFTRRVNSLQQTYLVQSNMARLDDWRSRPFPTRLLDNTARLLGPLL